MDSCSLSGVGLGLRSPHGNEVISTMPDVPWFEILADNYLNADGLPIGGEFAHQLSHIASHYPISFHCVCMSLGSTAPLDKQYFTALKGLIAQHNPVVVSDHLPWSNLDYQFSHDLLPAPYNEESLKHFTKRISQAQDWLEQSLLIENISMYLCLPNNSLTEAHFLNQLCSDTGCHILLDLNNLYVNHKNLGWDINDYLETINFAYVKQIHLAGFEQRDGLLVDTHGSHTDPAVLALWVKILRQQGAIPTLLEWDNNLPSLANFLAEREKIQSIYNHNLHDTNTTPDYAPTPPHLQEVIGA